MVATPPRPRVPQTHRVFLSSTSVDLAPYRNRVASLLHGSFQQFAVQMDEFAPRPVGTIDAASVSLAEVRTCDFLIVLVAWRYGYAPPGQTLSVTHQEYREARQLGLPCFAFLADPSTEADTSETALFPASVRTIDLMEQVHAFRAELEHDGIVTYFVTVEDVVNKVGAAFHAYLTQHPATPPTPRNLPPRAPGFVGREEELATLTQTLEQGQSTGLSPLVNGMGGVGKSALAAEVVHRLAQNPVAFPTGISWVRCDDRVGLDGLIWVYDQLLSAWEASLAPAVVARATALAAVELREQQLQRAFQSFTSRSPGQHAQRDSEPSSSPPALVLLDNVEVGFPLTRALETLTPLRLTVVVTARHRPTSNLLRLVPIEALTPQAAVALFAERYTAQGGDWQASCDEAPAFSVVDQLGDLPLAIELAAARAALTHTSVAALVKELTEAQRLSYLVDLASELPAATNRKGSVHYNLTRSLQTLTPLQRRCFAALGFLAGADWPHAFIESLFGRLMTTSPSAPQEGGVTPLPVANVLDVLVTFSLVTIVPISQRIRLHPLVRDLAGEEWDKLCQRTSGLQEAGNLALLTVVRTFITQHQQEYDVLAQEEDLLTRAIQQAATSPQTSSELTHISLEAIRLLTNYFLIGCHWPLGQKLCEQALHLCQAISDYPTEGYILDLMGSLAYSLGQYQASQHSHKQALIIYRRVGDKAGEADVLGNLGLVGDRLRHYAEAKRRYHKALSIYRKLGDRDGQATTLNNLGLLATRVGQYEQASRYYHRALPIWREVGNLVGLGGTINNLGRLAFDLQQFGEARRYLQEALPLHQAAQNRTTEATTLTTLGLIEMKSSRYDEARLHLEQALAIRRETGNHVGVGRTLDALGELAFLLKQYDQALSFYVQALRIQRNLGDPVEEAETFDHLTLQAECLEQYGATRQDMEAALNMFSAIGAGDAIRIVTAKLEALLPEVNLTNEVLPAMIPTSDATDPEPEPTRQKQRHWRLPWQK